jgi:hypothetical protein
MRRLGALWRTERYENWTQIRLMTLISLLFMESC